MRLVALSAMRLASSWLFSAQSYFDLFKEGRERDELGLEIYHTNDAHHMNMYINSSYMALLQVSQVSSNWHVMLIRLD